MLLKPISILSETTTKAASTLSTFHVKIPSPKRMTSQTMHAVQNRKIHSTQGVELIGNNLKVPWIYTPFVFAQMINLQVLWDWAKEELMRKAMGVFFLGVGDSITAISFSVTSCCPNPAPRLSIDKNLLSKTLWKSVNSNAKHTAPTIPPLRDVVGVFASGW
jgi:hypothetical protein